jgi:hypothetical protein
VGNEVEAKIIRETTARLKALRWLEIEGSPVAKEAAEKKTFEW